ncbi:2-keto-4-pentenoate hydratase [Endozoicomonas numazuensis]|uniref:Fumarylacetoacetase-like C-terminal domain-containing protein n=1 Tax=Endozoicomonas numazuensis TaxID=1137799 RepID=A0A081NMJ6_9GAMM|nr:fumarylacetoacetate hydrolase family protein [Endozoicomonas numazuensis]KEQ19669.1 hypothetical protein GZ78_07235 [Endozoicomonas numazuensis]
MNRFPLAGLLFFGLFAAFFIQLILMIEAANRLDEAAAQIINAKRYQHAAPVLDKNHPDLNIREAYLIQYKTVELQVENGERVVGYKAGLTHEKGQQAFKLAEPVTGALLSDAQWQNDQEYSISQGNKIMIEQELAFRLDKPVNQYIKNTEELRSFISQVAPAIELPDLGFDGKPRGVDIIANNVANKAFYIGQWQTIPDNLNTLELSLSCNGQTLSQTNSGNTMEGQWQAILWMINQQLELGYPLIEGHILMTGNLGKLLPGKPCKYSADFASLGTLEFTLTR